MYGMLFSIKSFVSKISPLDPKHGFLCYKTSKYALHYYESLTGVKFILNTDITVKNVRDLLQQLYKEVRWNILLFLFKYFLINLIYKKLLIPLLKMFANFV